MTSEAELVGIRGSGESDAFGTLVGLHGNTLFRYAYTLTGNAEDAQDLVQDVFMTAWRKRREVRVVDGSILPWLLVTTKNHAANLARKHRRRASTPLDGIDAVDTARAPQEVVLDRDELEWIWATIANLTPELGAVIVACLVDEKSYAEVAADFGLEVAAVKKRVSRARAQFRARRELGEEGVRV